MDQPDTLCRDCSAYLGAYLSGTLDSFIDGESDAARAMQRLRRHRDDLLRYCATAHD